MTMNGHRVFLVEDDRDIREVFAALLGNHGYQVAAAADGRQALDELRLGPPPCAILLDLMMPVMDGYEFRSRQLRDPALAPIPVIVMTADGRVGEKMHELGDVVSVMKKPIDVEELFRLLARVCAS